MNIVPKEKKAKLVLISARVPESDRDLMLLKLNNITTLSDAIKQLIKNYIKESV